MHVSVFNSSLYSQSCLHNKIIKYFKNANYVRKCLEISKNEEGCICVWQVGTFLYMIRVYTFVPLNVNEHT